MVDWTGCFFPRRPHSPSHCSPISLCYTCVGGRTGPDRKKEEKSKSDNREAQERDFCLLGAVVACELFCYFCCCYRCYECWLCPVTRSPVCSFSTRRCGNQSGRCAANKPQPPHSTTTHPPLPLDRCCCFTSFYLTFVNDISITTQ